MLDGKCVFCRIIKGEIPAAKVYEDGEMCVFKDLEPKAKVHLLAVPKTHFKLLSEAGESEAEILASDNGCANGYRLIINQGDDAGQTVFHLHIHILGGENLGDL